MAIKNLKKYFNTAIDEERHGSKIEPSGARKLGGEDKDHPVLNNSYLKY